MIQFSSIISASVFIIVIALIMSEKLHLTIAALLGALILIFTHTVTAVIRNYWYNYSYLCSVA